VASRQIVVCEVQAGVHEISKSALAVGTKRRKEYDSQLYASHKASILILALMVAPLVSLCGVQSGTAKQCPPLCPMIHGGTHETAEQTAEMQRLTLGALSICR
jgi:hypothetical protein